MAATKRYDTLSRVDLIARIRQLEDELKVTKAQTSGAAITNQSKGSTSTPKKEQKAFDFSAHPTRKIALKFTYDGSHYNGLEFQKGHTPLPTVEEMLWEALVFSRLVNPDDGFEGAGWEKCGRTDRGVSAAGQVVSFRIRSALKQPEESQAVNVDQASPSATTIDEAPTDDSDADAYGLNDEFGALSTWDEPPSNTVLPPSTLKASQDDNDELKYVPVLNRILPPTLRVLAWSPAAPDFSARFNCKWRHYKYFFVSRGLNIEAMRDGAERIVGEHDFRNLHTLDPAKQLTYFRRRILRAEINAVDPTIPEGPNKMYVLDLVGTAFLYNQVRCIMAILFLIGAGLEKPSLMTALLNCDPENPYPPFRPDEPAPPVVTTRPLYMKADALPLVLWDCGYGDGELSWRAGYDDPETNAKSKTSMTNFYAQMRAIHERSLTHAALHEHFLKAAAQYHPAPPEYLPLRADGPAVPPGTMFGVPLGGATQKDSARYVPVLERERLDHFEVTNERWRNAKGARKAQRDAAEDEAVDGGEE